MAKAISSIEEMQQMVKMMGEFAPIHNIYRKDIEVLVKALHDSKDNVELSQTYYRAIIIVFFAMIEVDIFYYNQFDEYPKYHDRQSFKIKFESTFPKVCSTWEQNELCSQYFNDNLAVIDMLREIRNNLAHPKCIPHVFQPKEDDIHDLLLAIQNYTGFINVLMSNFFFSYTSKTPFDITDLLKR